MSKKSIILKNCYQCGSTENLTRDHIPPENLFPSPKPSNLITVICCKNCNEKFKLIDESFRVFASSVYNRSEAGDWIWNNKVMKSTFKRSPKLKAAVAKNIGPVQGKINGKIVQRMGLTYPEKQLEDYLIKLTKGLTRHFNPEIDIDYSRAEFKISNIVPSQAVIDMLYEKHFYVERGNGVFRMWRMFSKDIPPISIWVFVFYDGLMFSVEVNPISL